MIYDWSGAYVGINGGYATGQSQWGDQQNPSGNTSTATSMSPAETSLSGLPVQNNSVFGWTVGGGLEFAFAENWTAKVEYLFVDLEKAACNHGYSCGYDVAAVGGQTPVAAIASNNAVQLYENIIRVGVNFKFGH